MQNLFSLYGISFFLHVAARLTAPIQDEFLSGVSPAPPTGKYFTIISGLISPASFGNVTLNSSSPFDKPIINPNVFSDPWDVAMMREAVKTAVRMANASSLASATATTNGEWITGPHGPLVDVINAGLPDDVVDEYVLGNATLGFHPTSTTRMTKVNGTDGVLDSSLRVMGAAALRIVDAGAMVSCFAQSASV
jgi:choline dehydrogenase-like flavoprotein